jgi:hypothetical protein
VAYNITMGNEPFPDSKKAYVEAWMKGLAEAIFQETKTALIT